MQKWVMAKSTYFDSYDELFIFSHGRIIRQRQETDFVKCIGSIWDQLSEKNLQKQHTIVAEQQFQNNIA